jgi:hypothetical protein
VKLLWLDGSLVAQPESIQERDALLLLWGEAKKSRRPGNAVVITDFGARFDGQSDDGPASIAACEALPIEP